MNMKLKSLFLLFAAILWQVMPARADIKDAANLAMDKLEHLTVKMEQAEQALATVEKEIERLKSGKIGPYDVQSFDEMVKSINVEDIEKIMNGQFPKIEVPNYFSGMVTELKKDFINETATKEYIATYEGKNDSVVAKEKARERLELLHNLVADMYATALATRVRLKREREELPPTEVTQENTRQLIEAIRAYGERYDLYQAKTNKMEAGIIEYEATLKETGKANYVSEDGEVIR